MRKSPPPLTPTTRRVLADLGADLSAARRRRRLPLEVVAQRAGITRQTLAKIEKGDPSVSMGGWASVLFALNLSDGLRHVASAADDRVGLDLEIEQLPQRVHLPKRRES